MNKAWGREERRGWPSTLPTCTIAALVIAIASVVIIGFYRYLDVWTPLQRLYLAKYFLTSLRTQLGPNELKYQLLAIVTRKGSQLALDDDLILVRLVEVRVDDRGGFFFHQERHRIKAVG